MTPTAAYGARAAHGGGQGPARSATAVPALTLGTAGLAAAAIGAGAHPAAVIAAIVAIAGITLIVSRGRELVLLLGALVFLLPAPESAVFAMLWLTMALIVGAAIVHPRAGLAPPPELRPVLAAAIALSAWLVASAMAVQDAQTGARIAVLTAVVLVFATAVVRLTTIRGTRTTAGILVALGGLAGILLTGRLAAAGAAFSGGDYASSKDAVFTAVGDVNGQAFMVMIGMPLALAAILAGRERRIVWAGAAAFAMGAMGLLTALSRSALLGTTVGCLVVALLLIRLSARRVAALGGAALLATVLLLPDIGRLSQDSNTLDTRQHIWGIAIEFWKERPILGQGPDAFTRLILSRAKATTEQGSGGTHNLFLSGLVSGGVGALLLQLLLIAVVAGTGIAAFRRLHHTRPFEAAIAAGALGCLAAIIARGQFEATGWPGVRLFDLRTWTAAISWTVVALIVALRISARSIDDSETPDLYDRAGDRPPDAGRAAMH